MPDRSDSLSARSARCSARLRDWLLEGPAQIREGNAAGGIAGTVDERGRASYVYAEITGYYLHWLAGTPAPRDLRSANANAAVRWCEREFAAGAVPATRIYLQATGSADWRNDAVFFFDLAMLIRGIAAAAEQGLIATPNALLGRLTEELNRFATATGLIAARKLDPSTGLPDRWSTRADAFLVKAATRALGASGVAWLPPSLVESCQQLCERYVPNAGIAPVEALHPTLYFLEGVVTQDHRYWSGAAMLLSRIVSMGDALGTLPESAESPAVRRSDIIAQALRLGVLLRQHEIEGAPSPDALERLASALIERVDADGGIAFQPQAQPALRNVWCAMFAEQALRWYAQWRDGGPAPNPQLLV